MIRASLRRLTTWSRRTGRITQHGPVSLAVVPFHRAGTSKGIPEKHRGQWSMHPLHDNRALVDYLRLGVAGGRYEVMLHGYYHDESDGSFEFQNREDLGQRITDGRRYLEDLLGCAIRVFVPPHNTIGRTGLRALAREGLHLGGVAGVRSGWSPTSVTAWRIWLRLRAWQLRQGAGVPWVLDLGDHREIAGNPVTPFSKAEVNNARFTAARAAGGTFCVATHYWELTSPSAHCDQPTVGEQLHRLVELALADPQIQWCSVGDAVCGRERASP